VIWILSGILWFGLLTMWIPSGWAIAAFDISLFGLSAVAMLARRLRLSVHPVAILTAAAACWGLVQLAFGTSVDPHRTEVAIVNWTANAAAFSMGLVACAARPRRQTFLTAQLLFAVGLCVVAIVCLFATPMRVFGVFDIGLDSPALGPFVYRNQFAAYVESVLGLAVTAAILDRRRTLAWVIVSAALFASVVAAGSRTGSILALAEVVILPILAFARGWISGKALLRVALASVAAAALLVAIAGWETIWQRLQEPNPYAVRADLARSSIAMARDRPMMGFGLGTWSSAYPAYARFDDGHFVNEAHNDWAQWAAEGGLPMLAIMIAIVALLARPAHRSLWGLGLMAVFVHALVDYPFEQRPALAAFFFALMGALAGEWGMGSG